VEKISVVIICLNEEKNIGRCIDSVKDIADEILILDSYSTDQTVSIAENKGAVVVREVFKGYIQQKNKAIEHASHNYILSLDADEALDPQLKESISRVKQNFNSRAYRMNRYSNYCGKFIRHGSWYPDAKIRLFDKRVARWGGTNPHDKIVLTGDIPVEHLKGNILHYSYRTISEHVDQNNKFSTLAAESLYANGKRTNIFKIFVHPLWAFIQTYLIRAGFLDGLFGLVIAVMIANLTFLKHLKLYLLQQSAK
jgi:glycosyltransferase involved in cell wall biosynthesis